MGEGFLYYWSFNNEFAMWIFGKSPETSEHGIEILEDDHDDHEICVEEIENNRTQVWTQLEWKEDLTLQIKCIDPDHDKRKKKNKVKDIIKSYKDHKTVPGSCCIEVKVSSVDIGQVSIVLIQYSHTGLI